MRAPMTDVVLVHGLFHQGAHFTPLIAALEARGMRVAAPTLHRGSLAADTSAVQDIVDACQQPPVVLGHSYGGAVITGLDRISALIYVAAFVPDAGESCATLSGADGPVNAAMRRRPDGGMMIAAADAVSLFYADCAPEIAAWATGLLRPQASGHGRGVPERQAWKQVPSTYVVCDDDHAVLPALQYRMAERCTRSVRLDAGHSPFLSRPDELTGVILSAA